MAETYADTWAVPGSFQSVISLPDTRRRRLTCTSFCSWKNAQLEFGSPACMRQCSEGHRNLSAGNNAAL